MTNYCRLDSFIHKPERISHDGDPCYLKHLSKVVKFWILWTFKFTVSSIPLLNVACLIPLPHPITPQNALYHLGSQGRIMAFGCILRYRCKPPNSVLNSGHLSYVMRKLVYVICEQQRWDQPAQPCSLISTFVNHCLDSISLLALAEISRP